jgi:hypothetical protein
MSRTQKIILLICVVLILLSIGFTFLFLPQADNVTSGTMETASGDSVVATTSVSAISLSSTSVKTTPVPAQKPPAKTSVSPSTTQPAASSTSDEKESSETDKNNLEKKADELCRGIENLIESEGGRAYVKISEGNQAIDYNGHYVSVDMKEIQPQADWVNDWKTVCYAVS